MRSGTSTAVESFTIVDLFSCKLNVTRLNDYEETNFERA